MLGKFTLTTKGYLGDTKLLVELEGYLEAERAEDLALLARCIKGTAVEADWIRLRALGPALERRPKSASAKPRKHRNEPEARDYH